MARPGRKASPSPKRTKDGKVQALFLIPEETRFQLRLYSAKNDVSMSQLVVDALNTCYLNPADNTPAQTQRMGPLNMIRTLIDPR